eukprot:NODE_26261_length_557_cov_3.986047.p4 GENE.NODE_26261_length_557_cov_3.986047~~NODE_26261_length_557_cov_3.986047.p4  ORF type:complete len:52 (+),score=10.33 NODE_26261_length_557_cov_3.986047:377-532(+)
MGCSSWHQQPQPIISLIGLPRNWGVAPGQGVPAAEENRCGPSPALSHQTGI